MLKEKIQQKSSVNQKSLSVLLVVLMSSSLLTLSSCNNPESSSVTSQDSSSTVTTSTSIPSQTQTSTMKSSSASKKASSSTSVASQTQTSTTKSSSTAKNSSSTITSSKQNEPYSGPVNAYGNTAGNLKVFGYAAIQGDWIYYQDAGKLLRMKNDGTNVSVVCNLMADKINVSGEWIVFLNTKNNDLCQIRIDGTGLKKLDTNVAEIFVANGWIYFTARSTYYMYKMKLDGSQKKQVFNQAIRYDINVIDDWIYWGNNINTFKVKTDGTEFTTYKDAYSQDMIISDGIKYTSGTLTKENIDGSNEKTLVESGAMDINISGDWIYFTYIDDGYCIYKIKKDGTSMTKVSSSPVSTMCIVGDWIFYQGLIKTTDDGDGSQGYRSSGFYRMKLDGSNVVQLSK